MSKELTRKTISLISNIKAGERRSIAINELGQIVKALETYSTQTGNTTAAENFKNLDILLKTYEKIQDGNEDNIGLLINLKVAKKNVLKDELRKKDTTINNSELTSVTTGVPLSLILKIAGKDKLTEDKRAEIIRAAASIINYAYRDGLSNGIKTNEYSGSFQRLEDVGTRNAFVKNILREILNEGNDIELKKLIKELQHTEKESGEKFIKGRINQAQIIFPLPAETLTDITPNKKETEVVSYLRNEINSRLQPTVPSGIGTPQDLIVLIDKDISNTTVETKQVKEIIANVFNNMYKDNVFKVNGQEAKVNTSQPLAGPPLEENPDWLFEVPKDPTSEITASALYKKDEDEIPRKNLLLEVTTVSTLDKAAIIEQDLIPTSAFDDPLTLFGSVSKCTKSTNGGSASNPINETPSEYSVSNNSFTFTLDTLENPTAITLMTSISITNGAPNGITGSYNIFDPVSGMVIYTEPFNIPDPTPIAKYVDLPVKTISGSALQAILNKLGTQTLSGLLVLVKIIKPGVPVFILSADFLDPLSAGESIPDTFKRPQTLPYISCSPAIQTISSGESAIINYTTGPEKSIQNVSVSSSSSSKNLDGTKGVISVKPTSDTTVTFTANSESGPGSTQCIVNVVDKNKKPGQIEVTVDDRFVNGYDVNEYKNYWHYPVEYKVDGKLIGEVDYFTNMSTVPTTVTPDQNHTVTLTINGKDVEDITNLIPSAPPATSFSFTGGIWRHYRGAENIPTILSSMSLITSEPADLGKGTYFTDLSEVPDCIGGENTYAIARILRLFKFNDVNGQPQITLNGNPIKLDNPKPGDEEIVIGIPPQSNKFYKETSASYIDILFNSKTIQNLVPGNKAIKTLKRQYMYPSNGDFTFQNEINNIFDISSFTNIKDCR